jgi:putative oxidoreductase
MRRVGNWFGSQKGAGWEYHLLVLAMSAVIITKGRGAWSIDATIAATSTLDASAPPRGLAGD